METQVIKLLNGIVDGEVRRSMEALDCLSVCPDVLLSISLGGENEMQKVVAATYLRVSAKRNPNDKDLNSDRFKEALLLALLKAEPEVLMELIIVFKGLVAAGFVNENSCPKFVLKLEEAIFDSDMLLSQSRTPQWKTINALTVLYNLIRPFQHFLNPEVAEEPVPPLLEMMTEKILASLISKIHQHVDSLTSQSQPVDVEKMLLMICKCIYCSVKSHMPSSLAQVLPSLCNDLCVILESLKFYNEEILEDEHVLRLKTGKICVLIFSALVTTHQKCSDKLIPDIIKCVVNIVKHSTKISKLDTLSKRIISLAFDVIAHVLEMGPGWRLVSPHFSSLLWSAIMPALRTSEKVRENLLTPRRSALNLLGAIAKVKVGIRKAHIAEILNNILDLYEDVCQPAIEALDRLLSVSPHFSLYLLSISIGGENQEQQFVAAKSLKNFAKRNWDHSGAYFNSKEFINALMHALLQVEPETLKVLIKVFRRIVAAGFVEKSMPKFVAGLREAFGHSDMILRSGNSQWKTINTLTVIHSLIRHSLYGYSLSYQYSLIEEESVPQHLEMFAQELLAPLISIFHRHVESLTYLPQVEVDVEKMLSIICKCFYVSMRSHMPSSLARVLPSLCDDLFVILEFLRFDVEIMEDEYRLRLNAGKSCLLIFSDLLVTHQKFPEKIIKCVENIVKLSRNINKLDTLSERIISLASDFIAQARSFCCLRCNYIFSKESFKKDKEEHAEHTKHAGYDSLMECLENLDFVEE